MKRVFTVHPKKWWYWFSPKFHRQRRVLQAYIDAHEAEIIEQCRIHLANLLLYGSSSIVPPKDFYGQGLIDRLLCKHESVRVRQDLKLETGEMGFTSFCNDCGEEL